MTGDTAFERGLGRLLRGGVILAASVTLVGGVMRLVRHGTMPVQDSVFAGEPARLRHVATIVTAAMGGDPPAVVQLGVLLLVGTPWPGWRRRWCGSGSNATASSSASR